ncbi:hypothetical protein ABZ858_03745 [Streptomyces sp. NPDC047017]|uniref:hypothetical protein n=1 Tax=Streptomyces sp. NPDC047017 TaxID=3155024 RepID=UPI0033BFC7C1
MHLPPRAARATLAVLALPLFLTACGPLGDSSATSSSSDVAPATSPAATSKAPDAGLPTGTRLKRALAPASFFPPGFVSDPGATRDTGDTYAQPTTRSAAKPDCGALEGTAWVGVTGIGGVSFAQGDYVDKATSAEIAQEIDVYRGTTAATVLKDVEKVAAACASFTDSDTQSRVRARGRATAGLGDEAYTITLTDSSWENGTTLIAVRRGTAVITVLSTDGHDDGAATAKKLARRITGSLVA